MINKTINERVMFAVADDATAHELAMEYVGVDAEKMEKFFIGYRNSTPSTPINMTISAVEIATGL